MDDYQYDLVILIMMNSNEYMKKVMILDSIYRVFNSHANITYRFLLDSCDVKLSDEFKQKYDNNILLLNREHKLWEALKFCYYGKLKSKFYLVLNESNMILHRNLLEMILKYHFDYPYIISGEQKYSNDYGLLYPSIETGVFISSYSVARFLPEIDNIISSNLTISDEFILGIIIREFKLVYICEPLMSNKTLSEVYQKLPSMFNDIDDYDILHERIDLTSMIPKVCLFSRMNLDEIMIYTMLGSDCIYYFILEMYLSQSLQLLKQNDIGNYHNLSKKLYFMDGIFINKYSRTLFLAIYSAFIATSLFKNKRMKIFILRDDYKTNVDLRIKYLLTKLNQYLDFIFIEREDMKLIEMGDTDSVGSNFTIEEIYKCTKVFDNTLIPQNTFSLPETQIILIENERIVKL